MNGPDLLMGMLEDFVPFSGVIYEKSKACRLFADGVVIGLMAQFIRAYDKMNDEDRQEVRRRYLGVEFKGLLAESLRETFDGLDGDLAEHFRQDMDNDRMFTLTVRTHMMAARDGLSHVAKTEVCGDLGWEDCVERSVL